MARPGLIDKLPLIGLRLARRLPPVVPVVRLHGVISPASSPVRGASLNLAGLAASLAAAFRTPRIKAVALAVNSPGGSPVQSALIHSRIRALAAEHEVPVYAFAEDVAASGGYWLALAADEIYADQNSILGSIGVVSSGFGFVGLLDKLGVERRLHAQGENKSLLDPFLPEKAEDVRRLTGIQKDIHLSFKDLVRARRGDRLAKRKDKQLFSGDVWLGHEALKLGLIDGIGDMRSVLRDKFGDDVKLKVMGPRRSWLRRRLAFGSGADSFAWTEGVLAAVEARALWSRFGL